MGVELGEIFDSAVSNSLFEDKGVLQVRYTPENIPHRDEQIKQMAAILAPVLRGERSSNLFVYGKTGTGKTLTAKFVLDELNSTAEKKNINLKVVYLNCKLKRAADTEYRLIRQNTLMAMLCPLQLDGMSKSRY